MESSPSSTSSNLANQNSEWLWFFFITWRTDYAVIMCLRLRLIRILGTNFFRWLKFNFNVTGVEFEIENAIKKWLAWSILSRRVVKISISQPKLIKSKRVTTSSRFFIATGFKRVINTLINSYIHTYLRASAYISMHQQAAKLYSSAARGHQTWRLKRTLMTTDSWSNGVKAMFICTCISKWHSGNSNSDSNNNSNNTNKKKFNIKSNG